LSGNGAVDGLQVRAAAALKLIASRELAPEIALSLVVWPPARLEEASAYRPRQKASNTDRSPRQRYSEDVRRRALELVDSGMSWGQAARELGVPKTTIGVWIKKRRVAGNGDGPR
jgi:hypothetical protein